MASVAASVLPASATIRPPHGCARTSSPACALAPLPARLRVSVPLNACSLAPDATRVVVVGADAALFDLLAEWLAQNGFLVWREAADDRVAAPVDIVIVDAPFDDVTKSLLLARVACDYPRVPILLLSSRLLAGVRGTGPVAQALGVSTVLPKPVSRDTLVDAVNRLRPS